MDQQQNQRRAAFLEMTIVETDKTYECGGYGFRIQERASTGRLRLGMSMELVVFQPRVNTPNRPQNHYHLSHVPPGQWVRLECADGEAFPIFIIWNGVTMQVRVGDSPDSKFVTLPVSTFSRAWKFDLQQNIAQTGGHFTHPEGIVSLSYLYDYPSKNWRYSNLTYLLRITGKLGGGMTEYDLQTMPEGRWVVIKNAEGVDLPLRVYKAKGRVSVEWLALAGSQPTATSTAANTGAGSPTGTALRAADVAKAAGTVVGLGLTALAYWKARKHEDSGR
jgi:hypothetical protein